MMLELSSTYPVITLLGDLIDLGVVFWTDLVIEQIMMRFLKSRGGLTRGRAVTESILLFWIHSMLGCTSVHNEMTELTNLQHRTSEQHM